MKNTLYILSFLLIAHFSNAQSPLYSISSYQDTYEPLDTFTSLFFDIGEGRDWWSLTFELGFDFPFFERSYDYINVDYNAYAHFDDTDFDISLFSFGYNPDIIYNWPVELESDVRYRYKTINGLKALVLEFLKNRLDTDPSVEEFDSHVNFQIWFFEDGSMEVRFGEINLENSPCYVPGEGFYIIFNNTPPDTVLFGPYLFLRNPDNPEDGIGLNGSYDDYEITSGYSVLTYVPPPGWVIRFNREPVKTKDLSITDPQLFPNPADGYFTITHDTPIDLIEIFDPSGRSVMTVTDPSGMISTETLGDGFYIMKCRSGEQTSTHKLVVQKQ